MYSFANCHLAWCIQSVTHLRCALYCLYGMAALPWCALVYANLLGRIPPTKFRYVILMGVWIPYAGMSCTTDIVSIVDNPPVCKYILSNGTNPHHPTSTCRHKTQTRTEC